MEVDVDENQYMRCFGYCHCTMATIVIGISGITFSVLAPLGLFIASAPTLIFAIGMLLDIVWLFVFALIVFAVVTERPNMLCPALTVTSLLAMCLLLSTVGLVVWLLVDGVHAAGSMVPSQFVGHLEQQRNLDGSTNRPPSNQYVHASLTALFTFAWSIVVCLLVLFALVLWCALTIRCCRHYLHAKQRRVLDTLQAFDSLMQYDNTYLQGTTSGAHQFIYV